MFQHLFTTFIGFLVILLPFLGLNLTLARTLFIITGIFLVVTSLRAVFSERKERSFSPPRPPESNI